MPLSDPTGGLVDRYEPDAGGVLDGLPLQRDLMLRGDGLRGIANRLHTLGRAVIETVEVVSGAAAPAAALCEGSRARGSDEHQDDAKPVVKWSVDFHSIAP